MRIAIVVAALVASISLVSSFAEESEKSKPSVVMQKKLEYSQNLLSALMSEDFEEASRNVKLLKTYTRLEEMLRSKKPGYREELDKFGDALDALATAVDAENHDRASKAYLDMLASCILCHRVMRNE